MILERLTLTDVGVYGGEQRVDFAPASRERPVTLIGGLNGAGKTTLMRSLFHVLYGAHALPLIERRGSYDRFLEDSTRKQTDTASIELAFVLQRNSRDERITIRRSWTRRKNDFSESVEAFRDNSYDQSLSEGWLDFIESVIPRGIARLVFFDGEQVEALADLDNASATLKTAIGSLLGLDLVDQLALDLEVLQRRRAVESASPEEQQRNLDLETKLAAAREASAESDRALADAESDVQAAVEDLTAAEEAFRSAGGDAFERRAALRQESEDAREHLRDAQTDARVAAAQELAPLGLLAEQVHSLHAVAHQEQRTDDLRVTRLAINDRDRYVATLLEQSGVPMKMRHEVERRLAENRDRLTAELSEQPASLSVAACAPVLDTLVSGGLAELATQRAHAVRAIVEGRDRLDRAERLATQVPTQDAIRALERARSDAADRVASLRARADACERARDDTNRAMIRALSERDRFATELANARLHREDSERIVRHAQKARATLGVLRRRAAERHLQRIAELTVEALEQLLRKERLIASIEIDPVSYAPQFRDREARPIRPEQLSAGERQLTALALLWALARASGRPLPVLIDTPLGRLDASHRRHVVGRYLPLASQQVIVLSTDTEIEASLLDELSARIGASYELRFDSETESTSITDGYLDVGVRA